jgi:hypothetical protein
MQETLAAHSIDFVICSPSYPNDKDYTWTTRLETVLTGLCLDQGEMRAPRKALLHHWGE